MPTVGLIWLQTRGFEITINYCFIALAGILNMTIKARPEWFISTFNTCWGDGNFSNQWKKQMLVLLPTSGKSSGELSSYCLVCLLDCVGEQLDRIICNWFLPILEEAEGMCKQQYDFRPGLSTVDTINLTDEAIAGIRSITVDMKNSFRSSQRQHIITSLNLLNYQGLFRR